jgi:AcrR family transcriptional regulator
VRAARDPAGNRRAIAEALLSLLRDGGPGPGPTAESIAARAGVSRRSVFVHFPSLDVLYAEAGKIQAERLRAAARRIDPALPLTERIRQFVAQRQDVYEIMTPVRRTVLGAAPASEVLSAMIDEADSRLRAQLTRVFEPELAGCQPHVADAIDAAVSWAAWYHLRRLGPDGARQSLTYLLESLLVPR